MSRVVHLASAGLCVAVVLATATVHAGSDFTYNDPGVLTPGSGQGTSDATVFVPNMRFPMEEGPAYVNSQVWGNGGFQGPGGSQCDAVNYSYPWSDNYCETRSWDMPLCPAGNGHQGQDIRAPTCTSDVHWNVATADGEITSVGSYSVYLTTADGTRFDFLHGDGNVVSLGDSVAAGDRINQTSNNFGDTATTIHLHFNIRQDIAGLGFVYVPSYMSLVGAYERLLGLAGDVQGSASVPECQGIDGWAQDPSNPELPIQVQAYFDGESGTPEATGIEVRADLYREELCDQLSSCEHGFAVDLPRSLRDDSDHQVYVYGQSVVGAELFELEASPLLFRCAPPTIPNGVRRELTPEVLSAWGLSFFWDGLAVSDNALDALPLGIDFPTEPRLVRSPAGALFVIDDQRRRDVADKAVARAWGLEPALAQTLDVDALAEFEAGPPVRERPFLLRGPDGGLYVVDDAQCPVDDPDCVPGSATGGSGGDPDPGDTSAGAQGTGARGAALPRSGWDTGPSGCGCAYSGSGPEPGELGSLFALCILGWRRRRSRALPLRQRTGDW